MNNPINSGRPAGDSIAQVTRRDDPTNLGKVTNIDTRKGQAPQPVSVTVPFVTPALGQARLARARQQNALPLKVVHEPVTTDEATRLGNTLGINPEHAKKLHSFVASTFKTSMTSPSVRKAEDLQAPGETPAHLQRTLSELRKGESIKFEQATTGSIKVPFYGVPGGLPALTPASTAAPGIDTAWYSPEANIGQVSSVTVARNEEGQLDVTLTRGNAAGGKLELGTFPAWTDDAISTPDDSSAYGFVYCGIRLGAEFDRQTSLTFTIAEDKSEEAIEKIVSGDADLSFLVDSSKELRSATDDADFDMPARAISEKSETTPVRLSLGANLGGGLGVSSPKTVVEDKYAVDFWLWPNADGNASIDIAKLETKKEDTGAEVQSKRNWVPEIGLSGSFSPMTFAVGHHIPKAGKEQFEDDFWILHYPVTVSLDGEKSTIPVNVKSSPMEHGGERAAFDAAFDPKDTEKLMADLERAGINPRIAQEILPELLGEGKNVMLSYEAIREQPEARIQDLDASGYRLARITVTDRIHSEAAPIRSNFDIAFVGRTDVGQVVTNRLAAVIEINDGSMTIKRPGGYEETIANPEVSPAGTSRDPFPTGLRNRGDQAV